MSAKMGGLWSFGIGVTSIDIFRRFRTGIAFIRKEFRQRHTKYQDEWNSYLLSIFCDFLSSDVNDLEGHNSTVLHSVFCGR